MRTTLTAGLACLAITGASCGGGPTGPLADDVATSLLESLAGSLRTDISIDLSVDADQMVAMEEAFPELVTVSGPFDPDDPDLAVTTGLLEALTLTFLKADDGSVGMALNLRGAPVVEVRGDLGQLRGLAQLAPDSGPVDATVAARVVFDAFTEIAELAGQSLPVSPAAMAREALDELPSGIPVPLLDVARAILEGQWAGVTGSLDLASLLAEAGVPADLSNFAALDVRSPSQDEVLEVLEAAVTFRPTDPVDGRATYVGDLHTGALIDALTDLSADLDPSGLSSGAFEQGTRPMRDLPDVEGLVEIRFDGNLVSDLVIDLRPALVVAAQDDLGMDDARAAAFDQALREADGIRARLVLTFSDHGQIPSTTDGLEATWASWEDLFVLALDAFASTSFDLNERPEMPEDFRAVQAALTNAAIAQETWFTDHSSYTSSLADLESAGFTPPAAELGVAVRVVRGDADGYCIEAETPGSGTWHLDSSVGIPTPGECP